MGHYFLDILYVPLLRQETTLSTRLSVVRVGKEARPLEVLVMFRGNGAGPVQVCTGYSVIYILTDNRLPGACRWGGGHVYQPPPPPHKSDSQYLKAKEVYRFFP